jgi:hypothetical protein
VNDAHWETDVLESAKRCRESRESGWFFVERELMIALECVDYGKKNAYLSGWCERPGTG